MKFTLLVPVFVIFLISNIFASSSHRHFKSKKNKKIVHGMEAEPYEFPYLASLVTKDQMPFCTGSIIDENLVLTAAHCLKLEPSEFVVIAGVNNYGKDSGRGQLKAVRDLIVHPKYRSGNIDYDIGLVIIDQPFEVSRVVHPIKLSLEHEYPIGYATIAGWGKKMYKENLSDIPQNLKKAIVEILPFVHCEMAWEQYFHLPKSGFCVVEKRSNTDLCHGNAGSPIVQKNVDGELVQIGLLNSMHRFCTNELPLGGILISHYIDWIKSAKHKLFEANEFEARIYYISGASDDQSEKFAQMTGFGKK